MKNRIHKLRCFRLSLSCIAALALLCGCVNLEPTKDATAFHVLSAKRNPIAEPVNQRVSIRSVQLADYLKNSQLVERIDANEIRHRPRHRWGSDLAEMIAQVIADEIEQSVPGTVVTIGESASTDRILDVQVLQFEMTPEGIAVSLQWSINNPIGNTLLAEDRSILTEEMKGSVVKTSVAQMELSLREIGRKMAESL